MTNPSISNPVAGPGPARHIALSLPQAVIDRPLQVDEAATASDLAGRPEALGHYLGSEQTLQLTQSRYRYPTIGDRKGPNEYTARGALTAAGLAATRRSKILTAHFQACVRAAIDAGLLPRLQPEPMRAPFG